MSKIRKYLVKINMTANLFILSSASVKKSLTALFSEEVLIKGKQYDHVLEDAEI